jgi:expansin
MRHPEILLLVIASIACAQIDYSKDFSKGRITWYAQSNYVACDIPQSEWPQYTAALSEKQFQDGLACGATAVLKNGDKQIEVMVVDLCPAQENQQWCSGDMTHFDLANTSTFSQLEDVGKGVTELQFKWVPTPVGDKPVKLRLKDGVNAYWIALQVLNHRYPVAKLELKDPKTGAWSTGQKTSHMWNYWQFKFTGSGLTAPYEIRITDQYGQVIEETCDSLQGNAMWDGAHQFPVWKGNVETYGNRAFGAAGPQTVFAISGGRIYCKKPCEATIVITDISGRSVARFAIGRSAQTLPLPHLPAGLYYVKVSSGMRAVSTLKWMKAE